jgi:NADPH:quinone reductase-like Zn-dependent oxidoreductase
LHNFSNGASKVVIASSKGIKAQLVEQLGAGDEIIELDRGDPIPQLDRLTEDNPYEFDIVVWITTSTKSQSLTSNRDRWKLLVLPSSHRM